MATSSAGLTNADAEKRPDAISSAPKLSRLAAIGNSKYLGLYLLAPAFLFVIMFFLTPVILTGVFGFTNMSTATGITGGSYVVSQSSMQALEDRHGLSEIADELSKAVYTIDEEGLAAAAQGAADAATVAELRKNLLGQNFDNGRDVERRSRSRTTDLPALGSSRPLPPISSARS